MIRPSRLAPPGVPRSRDQEARGQCLACEYVLKPRTMLQGVQALPAGVYVAMNGRWFPWDDVRKDRERGVFERITR